MGDPNIQIAPIAIGQAIRAICGSLSAIFFLLIVMGSSSSDTLASEIDHGVLSQFEVPAERVISLAPHLTELMFHIGAGESLVGVMASSDFPPAALLLPRVGSHRLLDVEKIISLRPDLVLGWKQGNHEADLSMIRRLGFNVFESNPGTLEEIAALIRQLGLLMDKAQIAESQARDFERKIAELRRRYAKKKPVRVFYQVWDHPIYTLNGTHVVSQLIEDCGGVNVFSELPTISVVVSVEAVLNADPDVIVGGLTETEDASPVSRWSQWPAMTAVAAQNLISINADHIARMGPRIVLAMTELCEKMDLARTRLQ